MRNSILAKEIRKIRRELADCGGSLEDVMTVIADAIDDLDDLLKPQKYRRKMVRRIKRLAAGPMIEAPSDPDEFMKWLNEQPARPTDPRKIVVTFPDNGTT